MPLLEQWGKSLVVRIPARVARRLKLYAGKRVDLTLRNGTIVVTPRRPQYRLRDLLKYCRPHQLHSETRFGPDVGREIVD
jgi:antitoxin MazE